MFRNAIVAGCAITLFMVGAVAQEHHNGGTEHLGTVHFATSCNAAAQNEVDRSVALLHSFQFSSAIQGFNAALISDPACGIAYWASPSASGVIPSPLESKTRAN